MGILDDIRFKRSAKQAFKEQVAFVKADIARHTAAEQQAQLKLDKLVDFQAGKIDEQYFRSWLPSYVAKLQSDPSTLKRAIEDAKQELMRWTQTKLKSEKILLYLRPNTKEDISERETALSGFAKDVLSVDPEGTLDLRFHSTTLASTRDIIQSGGLMSSVDRLDGFLETTNLSNEISVSDIQNIQYSMNFWTDIKAYNNCIPCGCMFVLQPRMQEEADMISGRQMHNVLFREHPEQLIAIATTSENISRVQTWLQENGLAKDLVCRFNELQAMLDRQKESLIPEYKRALSESLAVTPQSDRNHSGSTSAQGMLFAQVEQKPVYSSLDTQIKNAFSRTGNAHIAPNYNELGR